MNTEQRKIIEELYREMYDKLMVYACVNLDSESLAEEAVQETFHAACQKPESICESMNPQGWLVNTLKNTIRNMKRSRSNAKRILETYMMTQLREFSITEDRINLNVLYENVADLEEFKLLSEMAIEGRSHEEMARSRNISICACKKRVQRAKETLQRKIKV